MRTLTGVGSTPLSGVGTARWYRPEADLTLPERPDPATVDGDAEQARFAAARDAARDSVREARDRAAARVGEEEAAVFEAHEQFLDDPELVGDIEAAIAEGTPAPHAVNNRFAAAIEQFEALDGSMAERADDLRDVRDRLLRTLLNTDVGTAVGDLPRGTVLLAERLTPSDTVALNPAAVAGIATVTGGRTAHAAIIARSLSIPAVVGVGEALRDVDAGTDLLVDGSDGRVVVDPDAATREQADTAATTPIPDRVSTADGVQIAVAANVGSEAEVAPAAERGADGIGLFRTEFLFLDRESPPTEAEQYEAVTAALSAFPGEQVVARTLDVGGDKQVPYLDLPAESNPFLGRRGIRLCLDDNRDLFETQLRALLRAAAHGGGADLAVMFPLVSRLTEVESALLAVDSVAADLEAEGVAHAIPDVGVMVETPAAVFLADRLAETVDFLSIGTNDLTQYVMAADRENDGVAAYHDPLHPAVVRAIDRTTSAAAETDAWVGMGGEMAGDPALTELLVGLGLDELSMSAVTVPAVKTRIREIDSTAARARADEALACGTRGEVVDALGLDRD